MLEFVYADAMDKKIFLFLENNVRLLKKRARNRSLTNDFVEMTTF